LPPGSSPVHFQPLPLGRGGVNSVNGLFTTVVLKGHTACHEQRDLLDCSKCSSVCLCCSICYFQCVSRKEKYGEGRPEQCLLPLWSRGVLSSASLWLPLYGTPFGGARRGVTECNRLFSTVGLTVDNLHVQQTRTSSASPSATDRDLTLLRSVGFRIGLLLLGLAALSVLGLTLTTLWEQELNPGEKNLGVAALFVLWSLPVLFFGVAGVCFLLVSTTVFLHRRVRRRGSPLTAKSSKS